MQTDIQEKLRQSLRLPFRVSEFLGNQAKYAAELREYYHEDSGETIMQFTAREFAEGPPGHCHGGFIATLLDECMGGGAWWSGYVVLAADLQIKYRKSVPLNQEHFVISTCDRVERRRVYTTGKIIDRNGTVYATGRGVFIRVPRERLLNFEHGQFKVMGKYMDMREEGHDLATVLEALEEQYGYEPVQTPVA